MTDEHRQDEKPRTDGQKSDGRGEPASPRGWSMLGTIINTIMKDGSLAALAREGLKDVQDTFHEAAFGQGAHGREPGAPLTPLHSDIENARGHYQKENTNMSLSSSDPNAKDGKADATVHGPAREAGKSPSGVAQDHDPVQSEHAENVPVPIVPGGWVEKILKEREGNGGNDQSGRGLGRSLADEQRDKGRDR